MMSIFSATLSFIRIYFTGSPLFLFLNWNLFLAFIPWALTTYIQLKPHILKNKFALTSIVATWLLFFPNAPYIVTDLFHLRLSTAAPLWFDTVLIMSFSWAGLVFGFVSLMDIESLISNRLSPLVKQLTISSLLFLSAFGIYLGRFLRWNSWDILRDPMHLFSDIGNRILNPVDHPTTWGVTLLMGLLLNMMYWTIRSLSVSKNP
jgi:uncharacterized membrane protein